MSFKSREKKRQAKLAIAKTRSENQEKIAGRHDDYPAEERELIAGALAKRSRSPDETRTRAYIAKMVSETFENCTLGYTEPHTSMRARTTRLLQSILGVSARTTRRLNAEGASEARSFEELGGHAPPDLIVLHAATAHARRMTRHDRNGALLGYLKFLQVRGWF